MHVILPPEDGAEVIRALEHREELSAPDTEQNPRPSARQRRVDALVAIPRASLGGTGDAGTDGTKADRHLVVTHVDIEALMAAERQVAQEPLDSDAPLPSPLRAAIAGVLGGSISPATARRLAYPKQPGTSARVHW